MSVTGSSSPTSTSAASARLAMAIHASKSPAGETSAKATKGAKAAPEALLDEGIIEAPKPKAERGSKVGSGSTSTRSAAAGAKASPGYDSTGAEHADEGARNVQSVSPDAGAPMYSPDPYTPSQAEADSYSAQGADTVGGGAAVDATGAWSPVWEARFRELHLPQSDIDFLASNSYSEQELASYADELQRMPVLEAPEAGHDAGSARSADGPTAADVAPGQPGIDPTAATGTAWTEQWEQKFTDVMTRMGMSTREIDEQLKGVQNQPTTEAQLTDAYGQMEAQLGDFDQNWAGKFDKLLDELKTPAADKQKVMEQLAGSGLTTAKLQEAYSKMEASKPGWSGDWDAKFKALEVPDEMVKQLKESGAPTNVLDQQYNKLLDAKMAYMKNGRLDKLNDADASPDEKWGVMMQNPKNEDFDKVVEQIHSSHVPAWKRIGSFALNLVPGAFAVQYLVGHDILTGDKIDRTNPLNIVGAVASGFAGFTAVRSAVAGVQGLTAANAAAQATKAAAGGASLADAVTGTSALSKGSFSAIEAAGLVTKFDKGLKFTDYLKSAVPIVNRFGEAGRLSSVGRGYFQGMQLAAGAAALKDVEGGGAAIDAATKGKVLDGLKQGKGIDEALTGAGRTGRAGDFALDGSKVARDYNRYGFLQGNVSGKFGVGNGSGNFALNPFKNTNTISNAAGSNVFNLGRSVNFGSTGGLAQGLGAVRGANLVSNPGLATQAAVNAGNANKLMQNGSFGGRITGLGGIEDGAQRVATMEKTTEWAQKLGVTGGGKFRTLLQLGSSNDRSAARIAGVVENGGSSGYRAARYAGDVGRRWAGFAVPPLVGGAVVGMTGKQMQPGWDYLKHRGEIQAEEQKASKQADREAAELERLYAEQHGGASPSGGATDAQEGAAMSGGDALASDGGAPTGPQVVGTSPQSGGQLVFDPSTGYVHDDVTGDIYDANTGKLLGNGGQQYAGQAQGQAPATVSGGAATTDGGAPQVYVDPSTGYYVDPTTGLMADPKTGDVYDPKSGSVVGNVNQPAA